MSKKNFKENLQRKWYWFAKLACRIFATICFKWRCEGLDNIPKTGSFLIICNHQSYLDPIFCGSVPKRHFCFMARETLFKNWFFGPLIRSVYAIPVRRGQSDLAAMKKVISVLKDGDGFCLFAEGTRTEDGRIRTLKPGFGLLCRRGNATVVPVVIEGAFECWPRDQKMFKTGSPILVQYGKAISAEDAKKMGDEKLAEHLTDTLRKMQNDCRIKMGREPFEYNEENTD